MEEFQTLFTNEQVGEQLAKFLQELEVEPEDCLDLFPLLDEDGQLEVTLEGEGYEEPPLREIVIAPLGCSLDGKPVPFAVESESGVLSCTETFDYEEKLFLDFVADWCDGREPAAGPPSHRWVPAHDITQSRRPWVSARDF